MRFAFPLLLLLAGCRRAPEWYALPPQQPAPPPPALRAFIDVSEPGGESQWAEGLAPGTLEGNWIWAARRVALRVQAPDARAVKLRVEYGIGDESLQKDGTVTLRFFLDDRPLGEQQHRQAGAFLFTKDVPRDWIQPSREQRLTIESDRYWRDGARELSFLLSRAGLVQ